MRKLTGILMVAVALGMLMSLLKGTGAGARDQLGNLSAPWLAVGFLGGACCRRTSRGAVAGVVATLAALAGFYAQQSPLAGFSSASLAFLAHPRQMYDFIVVPHRIVFIGGIASGLLFGTLGGVWTARQTKLAAGAIAALLICEPFVWLASGQALGGSDAARYAWIWVAEIVVGCGAAVAIMPSRRHPT